MELRLRNNMADMIPLFFALVVIFGVAIFAVILYNAYDDNIKDNLNDALTSSTPVDSDANVTKILDDTSSGIGKLNPLFPFLLVGIFGFVLMTALLGRSHPMFFFIGLIVLGVAIIIAVTFSNVYESITDNVAFADEDSEFSIMGLFLNNLPTIIFILFIIISIILYGGRGNPGGNY